MSDVLAAEPWRPVTRISPRPDPILAGLWNQRSTILSRWPGLPLPTRAPLHTAPRYESVTRIREGASIPFVSGDTNGPGPDAPAASLLLLWERWEFLGGECPSCGGDMLGTAFGGIIHVGSVSGRCVGCGATGTRFLPGFPFAEGCCRSLLADTPWRLPWKPVAFTLGGPAKALCAVLEEEGVSLFGVRELLPELLEDLRTG